jgi:hypothetical protein
VACGKGTWMLGIALEMGGRAAEFDGTLWRGNDGNLVSGEMRRYERRREDEFRVSAMVRLLG